MTTAPTHSREHADAWSLGSRARVMPTNDGSESSAGASKNKRMPTCQQRCGIFSSNGEPESDDGNGAGEGSGSTRWNGGTEHERRRHGGDALRADRPAEWPASPAWRSLRLISVAPFLRVEPFPPSSPLTRGPHSVVRGKPWRPCSAGTRRRCRRTHARWRDPSARRNHSSAR